MKKWNALIAALLIVLLTAACGSGEFDVTSSDGWVEPASIEGDQGEENVNAEPEQSDVDVVNMDSRENMMQQAIRSDENDRQVEMAADENADTYILIDGEPATRAYLTLQNDGAAATLTDISTDVADEVIIVRSTLADADTQGFDEIDELTIGGGETLEMSPEDVSLFLVGLTRSLDEDQTIELSLTFEGGETISATAEVRNVN